MSEKRLEGQVAVVTGASRGIGRACAVELAREAFVAAGLKPYDHVVRGGTDGSRLTELGLPTPNLFCGEHNAHGPLEWVAVQDMELAVNACAHLIELWERKA